VTANRPFPPSSALWVNVDFALHKRTDEQKKRFSQNFHSDKSA